MRFVVAKIWRCRRLWLVPNYSRCPLPHVKFRATRFQLDKSSFTRALSNIIIDLMTKAAQESLQAHYHRIPVWTGESRGGLRALAEALGVALEISPEPERRIRFNRFGRIKGPDSAESTYQAPRRDKTYSVQMSFRNMADGFTVNDMHVSPATNLRHNTPWNFTESFRRGIRSRLARMMRNYPLPVDTFVLKKKVETE